MIVRIVPGGRSEISWLCLLTFLYGLIIAGGCSLHPRADLVVRSPEDALLTTRRLANLSGGTRLSQYEDILGADFTAGASQLGGPWPFQIFHIPTSSDGVSVELEIRAAGPGRDALKSVAVRVALKSPHWCLSKDMFDSFAAANYRSLGFRQSLGYSYTLNGNSAGPVISVSYASSSCCSGIGIFYPETNAEWAE